MAITLINIGQKANDGTGDPLRSAFEKVNQNMNHLAQTKADQVAVETALAEKADQATVNEALDQKADKAALNDLASKEQLQSAKDTLQQGIDTKASQVDLEGKADKTALEKKANIADVEAALQGKADQSALEVTNQQVATNKAAIEELSQKGVDVSSLVGAGLENIDSKLAVKAGGGIVVNASGVSVDAGYVQSNLDIATSSDITAGTAGKLVDAEGLRAALGVVGKIELMPFRATELPKGWLHANGDQYQLDSDIGRTLKALSEGYKEDWKIVESGGLINVPNMYHDDGRAYFPRAGATPAVVQEDAIRNIEGKIDSICRNYANQTSDGEGVLRSIKPNSGYAGYSDSLGTRNGVMFNASFVVPTAEENRPLNISFVPAIYMGV